MQFDLTTLRSVVGGTLIGSDHLGRDADAGQRPVERVVIDSRSARRGDLFVAVVAERDGHDFAASAVANGASAVLAAHPLELDAAVLVVDDTIEALTAIGTFARTRLAGPVIGVTGSVGKTSTKDLLAAICERAGITTASEKSLNNELGVPLTLANAEAATERTIVEMGARGVGHIAHLCRIASPTHAIVTAVGKAHTELFGDLAGVALAKGELVEALPADGVAILNADDPLVAAMASRTEASVLFYGAGARGGAGAGAGDVWAEAIELGAELRPRFELRSPWGSASVELGVSGLHNVSNALAAAAAALSTGVSLEHVVAGLAAASLSPSRMAVRSVASGGVVIDDAYNANPTSMRAALESLAAFEATHRVAVLGYMAELGADAPEEHRAIAAFADSLGIEVVAVGTELYGIEPLPDVDAAITVLRSPRPGDAVLLKASRVAGLDRIAAAWADGDPRSR